MKRIKGSGEGLSVLTVCYYNRTHNISTPENYEQSELNIFIK